MVRKVNGFWMCEECKLIYREREWAEKCEDWCKKHRSCNLYIIRHAIKNDSSKYLG